MDGYYSIWPTGDMNGPDVKQDWWWEGTTRPYNNYWADIRSIDKPMQIPTSDEITENWMTGGQHTSSVNTRVVSNDESSQSGKLLIVNGSRKFPIPHDIIKTTVRGLKPHTDYTVQGFIANLSDYPYSDHTVDPVQLGFVVNENFIGTSQESPKQTGALNSQTHWTPISSIVNTGDSNELTISARNYKEGSWGNDFAIDQLSLYPLATASAKLAVNVPGYDFKKSSDPKTGSKVMPGDVITYTLQGINTGQTDLLQVSVNDNLTDVLKHADLLENPVSDIGDAHTVSNGILSWKGSFNQGQTVHITYKIRVHDGNKAAWNVKFENHATSQATPPGNVPPITPPEGHTDHHTPQRPATSEQPIDYDLANTGSNVILMLIATSLLLVGALAAVLIERSGYFKKS
ncbi:DUF11 domain-containing protein [Bombiscardovia coagulans]|uniref:DUF7927 domain-containing protein n=1 Tax=Bombiscardovia coagulans TaxID=686666 RepID=A0A261EQX4_9BIFI|nr:DUF11 domain-containing protein [Bombiscardovia coagulans]OZG49244.1 hypothetical protein BOCO_1053 [Bombiscardovia coagulans]